MNGIDRYVPTRRSTHRPIAPGWVVSTLVLVLTLLTGCVPIQPAATNAAPNQAITLRFAVPEAQGRTLTPLVLEFVDQVKTLSQGSITIEPVWDPTAGTPSGGENKLIQMVLDGQFDFGLAASRSWDDQNIPSLHVLQTPFLISNDALAEAVATSEVATRLLNDLSSAGAVGLAMWPEDLRHPFSVVPDKPLLSPQDFVGAVIRASATGVTHQLIMALGATTTLEDSGYQGAESGLLHAYTLMGKPVPTGNVTFYAKFQTFFASAQAFDKLSDAQRTLVRQAATATLAKAIAEHPKEVDAATAYCADGGTIVVTTDEQVAAFEKAAKPVLDQIAQTPGNAELIAMLRDLKAKTPPSAGASACAPTATQPSAAPKADAQVWSKGLPPNGVWQVKLTTDELVQLGMLRSTAADWAGVTTITFQDGQHRIQWVGEQGQTGDCTATYEVVGDVVRITRTPITSTCPREVDDIQWRLDKDGLHLHLVATPGGDLIDGRIGMEAKPWQKVK